MHKGIDRNRLAGPWRPLVHVQVPEEMEKDGVEAMFANNRCTVIVRTLDVEGLAAQGPSHVAHLMVRWARQGSPRSWNDLQRIKDEVCGPEAEAVELFPAQWRKIDMDTTHLWALPPGQTFPIGMVPQEWIAARRERAAQYDEKDLRVAVVRLVDTAVADSEVFADLAEAEAAYAKAAETKPGMALIPETVEDVLLKDAPSVLDPRVVWSPAANAKLGAMLHRAEILDKKAMEAAAEAVAAPPPLPNGQQLSEQDLKDRATYRRDRLARAMVAAHDIIVVQGVVAKPAEQAPVGSQVDGTDANEEAAAADLEAYRRDLVRGGENGGEQ